MAAAIEVPADAYPGPTSNHAAQPEPAAVICDMMRHGYCKGFDHGIPYQLVE